MRALFLPENGQVFLSIKLGMNMTLLLSEVLFPKLKIISTMVLTINATF